MATGKDPWQGGKTPDKSQPKSQPKITTKGKITMAKTKTAKGKAKTAKKAPPQEIRRTLTAAEYRALEKAAHALETALRIRRKYQFAVLNATECVERKLDQIFSIVQGEAK
jgi:hypothetical protein